MKSRSIFALMIFVIVSLACAGVGAEPIPTSTPEPPTVTPEPTKTPTLVPTATPNRTATVQAQATVSANEVLAELEDVLGETEIPYQNGRLLWKQDEKLDIEMSGPDGRFVKFAENVVGRNFILKSDVTWNSTGILVCGAIFRSEDNIREGKQYHFVFLRFSGAPAWAIEFYDFGYFKNSPSGVKYSSAVNLANDATNQFVLVAQEGEFTVFINEVRQGRFFDYSEQRKEGAFAFFAGQDSGEGSCEYENSWVWELE
ncbi:MAG: hypothetical protein KF758_03545 [Anaerolineales bacterium]|nr:hypothetical protein [Anaerolineales bacterium]MBX3035965.1 hypothetical protein [Anaerolineales bacterium]